MDFLRVLDDPPALLCTRCQFLVNPHNLTLHLRAAYAWEIKTSGRPATVVAEECYRRLGLGRLPYEWEDRWVTAAAAPACELRRTLTPFDQN
jgi:hypothetical protein